jgi:hypothetical protein
MDDLPGLHRIVIASPLKFREAYDFAQNENCLTEFALAYVRMLRTMTTDMVKSIDGVTPVPDNVTGWVHKDFGVPYSFNWAVMKGTDKHGEDGKCVYHGGLVYAGPGQPGDGSGPAFCVSLSYVAGQAPKHSWGLHT